MILFALHWHILQLLTCCKRDCSTCWRLTFPLSPHLLWNIYTASVFVLHYTEMLNELVLPIPGSEILALGDFFFFTNFCHCDTFLTLIVSIEQPPKDFGNEIDFIHAVNVFRTLSSDDTLILSPMKLWMSLIR